MILYVTLEHSVIESTRCLSSKNISEAGSTYESAKLRRLKNRNSLCEDESNQQQTREVFPVFIQAVHGVIAVASLTPKIEKGSGRWSRMAARISMSNTTTNVQ
jgi:hypothetical protein